ncbi:MAG: hypothetical protein MASP_01524 [Candidatus Methanolliviera sp. GoM_asphalt]|nr:MAG: hypothetical protein MASP_01524 [Candidatus Methanolliviera sp. GoM_asphalt]
MRVVKIVSGKDLEELKKSVRKEIMDQQGYDDVWRGGYVTCPNCGKVYKPKYPSKEEAPMGTIWREQWMSGIYSDRCWGEYLGVRQNRGRRKKKRN